MHLMLLSRSIIQGRNRALATIVLSIDPSLLYLIGDPKEPVKVWQKLRSQFQKKTWTNKLVLRCRLHSLPLKEGEPVQEHIKKMTELFNELDAIGAKMEVEDRYDTLVTALEANEKLPSMEIVIDRLLHEKKKSKDRHGETETDRGEALAVRSKPKWKGVCCHHCRKLGHIQKDCYERGERKNYKSNKSQHKSSGKRKGEDGTSIGLVAVHTLAADSERESHGNDWIIDSGATCHICYNKTMFDNMESMDEPQVVTYQEREEL